MKVSMKEELIEKGIVAKGFKTKPEAAKKIGCDPRTLGSAINGDRVLLRIAMKICKALDLKRLDAITQNSNEDTPLPVETTEERILSEFSKATKGASQSAIAVIDASLEYLGKKSPEEVAFVLTRLICHYAIMIRD